VNVFARDDLWQRHMRDAILAPGFYGRYAQQGRYVFIDKGQLASQLQRDYAVDTIIQGRDNAAVCIEEKIVRWPRNKDGSPRSEPYTAFALETWSCTVTGREKPGWMQYGQADFLLYCFTNERETALDCHLIDFPRLQEWFWPRENEWPTTTTNQSNHTRCRVVPISEVQSAVKCWRRLVAPSIEDTIA
jgi:hypothetical protein